MQTENITRKVLDFSPSRSRIAFCWSNIAVTCLMKFIFNPFLLSQPKIASFISSKVLRPVSSELMGDFHKGNVGHTKQTHAEINSCSWNRKRKWWVRKIRSHLTKHSESGWWYGWGWQGFWRQFPCQIKRRHAVSRFPVNIFITTALCLSHWNYTQSDGWCWQHNNFPFIRISYESAGAVLGEKITSGNENCYWCDGKNMYLMSASLIVGLIRVVVCSPMSLFPRIMTSP